MTIAGIIGFGLAGRYFHTPLLQAANIEVRAVVSRQHEGARAVLPDAQVLEDDAALLARPDIDLIVIATPNHLHAAQAAAALRSGKHVVVDKPLCLQVSEGAHLIDLARAQRRMLAVFHNRRWDCDFLTIKKLVDDGRLGALNAFHARWDRYRPMITDRWREHAQLGNGVLYDLGTHLIDQALCLFGMPDWVQADVFAQRDGAIASDGFEILLAKGAARITLGVSTLAAEGGARYRVHGAQGSYVKCGLDVQESQLRAGMAASASTFGIEPPAQWGVLTHGSNGVREVVESERGRWTLFYPQVRACLELGASPPVSAEAGLDVIRVLRAAQQSSESGARVQLNPT